MFNKLRMSKSAPTRQPRIAYIALNDGIRISSSRTLGQNVNLLETRLGMSPTKAAEFAQAIQRVFEASS